MNIVESLFAKLLFFLIFVIFVNLITYSYSSCSVLANTHQKDDFAQINSHKIYSQSLSQGAYSFEEDGSLPKEVFKRLRKIHLEIMSGVENMSSFNAKSKYLLTVSNTALQVIQTLRNKFKESGVTGKTVDKIRHKADSYLLLISHGALVSNCILYFPDIMNDILRKNPLIKENYKWLIEFIYEGNLIKDDNLLTKLFDLAQQEAKLIERKENFVNPYSKKSLPKITTTTTTKKPRKRLARGPTFVRGDL